MAKTSKDTTVVANDAHAPRGALKHIGGSQSDNWNDILAKQTIQTLWLAHSDDETRGRQFSATITALIEIGPKDQIEGMIAAQLIAAHNASATTSWNDILAKQTIVSRLGLYGIQDAALVMAPWRATRAF